MADNKLTITYGAFSAGGTSDDYLIDGPYSLDKSFNTLQLSFRVVVVATSFSELKSFSDAIETAFRKRDQTLVLNMDGNVWTYAAGADILNVTSGIAKSGDIATDRGYSRAYVCNVDAELPADDALPTQTGLRDISFSVDFAAGRQRVVTVAGVYTATTGQASASLAYLSGADAEVATFLATIGLGTFELTSESYEEDRTNQTCAFARTYSEILFAQSQAVLDDTDIKDHRVSFTDVSQFPGDSRGGVFRLRRVVGSYECALDVVQAADLAALFTNKVEPHLKAVFEVNFAPSAYAIESATTTYDETAKRLAVSFQFIYQTGLVGAAGNIIELSEATAYHETRNLDMTPLHDQNELAAIVDPGWATRERISTRTVLVLGAESPKKRLGAAALSGVAGPMKVAGGGSVASGRVKKNGWNLVDNRSQTAEQWVGDPAFQQMKMTMLSETVVEVFNEAPRARSSSGSGSGGGNVNNPPSGQPRNYPGGG